MRRKRKELVSTVSVPRLEEPTSYEACECRESVRNTDTHVRSLSFVETSIFYSFAINRLLKLKILYILIFGKNVCVFFFSFDFLTGTQTFRHRL